MKSTIIRERATSFGDSCRSSHVNDEIGYTLWPGAFVIETRKSFGMFLAAAEAALETVSVDARTHSPARFCTAPYAILFCDAKISQTYPIEPGVCFTSP